MKPPITVEGPFRRPANNTAFAWACIAICAVAAFLSLLAGAGRLHF